MTISHTDPKELLPFDDESGPILQIGPDRLVEAIERLTSPTGEVDSAHAQRFIRFAREMDIELTWLWSRLDDREKVLLTSLFVPSPGRTCMVFATNPVSALEIRSLAGILETHRRVLETTELERRVAELEQGKN